MRQLFTRARIVAISLLAFLVTGAAGWIGRSELRGWYRGEARFRGHYTNFWEEQLMQWRSVSSIDADGSTKRVWYRGGNSFWDRTASKMGWSTSFSVEVVPPIALLEGEPEALPVLMELSSVPQRDVRLLVALGVYKIPAENNELGDEALVLLRRLATDADRNVRNVARATERMIHEKERELLPLLDLPAMEAETKLGLKKCKWSDPIDEPPGHLRGWSYWLRVDGELIHIRLYISPSDPLFMKDQGAGQRDYREFLTSRIGGIRYIDIGQELDTPVIVDVGIMPGQQ
jgi:hypothetical protein